MKIRKKLFYRFYHCPGIKGNHFNFVDKVTKERIKLVKIFKFLWFRKK